MKKFCLKFSILLFSCAGLSQTYTITQKPSYMPNTSTYTVKQQGTGAYANPQTYTPTTTSAQHIQNMQNNISSSMNTVSSSMGSELNRQRQAEGMVSLGNASFQITKVGSSGFVGLKKLKRIATEEIESFANKSLSNYEITNIEEHSQSFGVLPKVIVTFKLINEDGTLKLSRDETISENKKKLSELKNFLEMGVINQAEYDEKSKIPKEILKKMID